MSSFLETAIKAAKSAGDLLKEHYYKDKEVDSYEQYDNGALGHNVEVNEYGIQVRSTLNGMVMYTVRFDKWKASEDGAIFSRWPL